MNARFIKVRLLGKLGKMFFKEHSFFINTPRDAIELIKANFPDFAAYVRDSEAKGSVYRVVSGNPLGRDEDELEFPCEETLIIAELDQGAGSFGKILLGAALLGASFFMPASVTLLGATFSSFAVGALGASLILGGISEAIAPKSKPKDDRKPLSSNSFGSTAGVATQALPVPLAYGYGIYPNPPIISQGVSIARLPAY